MSKLEELLQQLCPDGVEYKKLGDIATITRGGSLQKKDFIEEGYPCIHYGQIYTKYPLFPTKTFTFISLETAKKQRKAQPNDIVMAVTSENVEDVCKCVAWMGDTEIAVSGHTAIIHHDQNPKFLTYYFYSKEFFEQKKKLAHGTKVIEVTPDRLGDITLPVPPLQVQREIVRILDNFMNLTAELTAELTARKKQYEFYREELYKKVSKNPTKKLHEVAKISRGVRVVKKDLSETGGYPVFQNCLTPMGYYDKMNCEANTTYLISAGAAGEIGFSKEDFWAADDCFIFTELNGLLNKYIYYFLLTKYDYLKSNVRKASVPRLSRTVVENLEIPITNLEEQQCIIDILDRFDSLCSSISAGLPAEIEARKKQYEYYRDKLLTFKRKEA